MSTYRELEAPATPSATTTPLGLRKTHLQMASSTVEFGAATTAEFESIELAGTAVDLMDREQALRTIIARAADPWSPPLAVVSANLDHVHHFGRGSRWGGVLDQARAGTDVDVLTLLDGMPLVRQAERVTGRAWPQLAGSDLIDPILDAAAATGLRVGFLGGLSETHDQLRDLLAERRPDLVVAGFWSPGRDELSDPAASRVLAEEIADARVDILAVCLGKPRQELWIAEHGAATGACVLLAFGAAVDFVAEKVTRAPQWVSSMGLEWSYRLAQEPRRLARRYLVQGPPSYWALRAHSGPLDGVVEPAPENATFAMQRADRDTDHHVTAVVVTHNSEEHVSALLDSVRAAAGDLLVHLVAVDNDSTDATVAILEGQPDVTVLRAPGNVGRAGGVNLALDHLGPANSPRAVLVLDPDLRLEPDALGAMWTRLWSTGVGAVVPRLTDPDGALRRSLRFEPTALRTLADSLLGSRLPDRATWAGETDRSEESYCHPHPVDWTSGNALLVRRDVLDDVGAWDDHYFLSGETVDYPRRIREAGWQLWFEPDAAAVRAPGRSDGADLRAQLAVDRVRYVEATQGRAQGLLVRLAALLGALLRSPHSPADRRTASYLASRRRWDRLPSATRRRRHASYDQAAGAVASILVPAHNEARTITRTLEPLSELALAGAIELLIAADGCVDATVERARTVPGTTVLDLPAAGKRAALNAAEQTAQHWPRIYLDADISITPQAVLDLVATMEETGALAARPAFRYESAGASWPVRAYYRARARLPETREHLWGAGGYALSRRGRERFATFPDLVADDVFIDSLFTGDEKIVVDTDPMVVTTPSDVRGLMVVLRRVHGGNHQVRAVVGDLAAASPRTTDLTVRQLLRSVTGPARLVDASAYAVLTLLARAQARGGRHVTDRPERSEPVQQVETPAVPDTDGPSIGSTTRVG